MALTLLIVAILSMYSYFKERKTRHFSSRRH
ncbi:small membrane protein [Tatumella sp. JGM130]|nr:small membrane protein [Tatumella sp. JGM130]